jgi:hypothetical protein
MNFLMALSVPFIQSTGLTLPNSTDLARTWEALTPASCMPNHCFCEPVVSGLIRQPINTWTNLAFILAAAMTALVATLDLFGKSGNQVQTNLMRSQWIYPATYAYTATLVGIGSIFYHGTMAFYGQVLDILGMYLISTFMALYNLSRAFKLKGSTFFGFYVGINIILGYISTTKPELRRPIFIGILVVILASELLARKMVQSRMSRKMLGAALISLVIGCSAWVLDVNGFFCMPNSWLQLHSTWHIAMAAAIGFLYLYYRSERPIPDNLIHAEGGKS